MDKLLLALSTLCFLGGFLYAVTALKSGKHSPTKANLVVIGLGFLLQCGFLHLRGQLHGRCPVTNGPEVFVFLCWATVLLYFILGRTFRLSLLGVFTSPMVFVFQAIALILLLVNDPGPRRLESVNAMNELHIAVSLVAYGSFALAGVAGIMYLVQDHQLKKHQLGPLFHNLPPIRYLVDALKRILAIGITLLAVGIGSAFFMGVRTDAFHMMLPILLWVIYAVLLGLQVANRISPKKFAAGAVAAALLAFLTLVV